METFSANALPVLIGSLPMESHDEATALVLSHTSEIPLWVQLPKYPEEGMIAQFITGMPGYDPENEKSQIDTSADGFDDQMIAFFEEFLSFSGNGLDLAGSRFALTGTRGRGMEEFLRQVDNAGHPFAALKGQVTGPITFGTGVKDQDDKDIFYNSQVMDAAVKLLALNARWQAAEFAKRGARPIVFIDEPVLAGFGTSAYITISKEDVTRCIDEITQEIHAENGLAGVHVCANTEWDILLNSTLDIISFDAFAYFDRFILYPEQIKNYLGAGKVIAWGIVPTLDPDALDLQTTESLVEQLGGQMQQLSDKTGINLKTIIRQSLVTPSCGTGSLDLDRAKKVLKLTCEVSKVFQKKL